MVGPDAFGRRRVTVPDPRSALLHRVRSALAVAPPGPVRIRRNYHRATGCGPGDLRQFAETVTEYRAHITSVHSAGIGPAVASLHTRGKRIVVPADVPNEWTAGCDTIVDRPDQPLTAAELDRCAAVLTGCALAIASTGTIVLDAGPVQGRRLLTLVPDHHICVVFADQVVNTVPQAFAALNPVRPLTFISGPSATSDIELIRVEGVHGPRNLDVLLVDGSRDTRGTSA